MKSKSDSRLELDITIMADVCLLPRLEHLGMALVEGRKYFSQMMDSQKPLRGAVQIEIRDAAVQDYKIPFRCLTQDEETIPALSFKFSLADSRRREGCRNMRLEEHGIELSLRKQTLTLLPNKPKALLLRVIKAAPQANGVQDQQHAIDPNASVNSSTLSGHSRKSNKK